MNKKLEVALITTDQLHNEFDKIKELIKNELLKMKLHQNCKDFFISDHFFFYKRRYINGKIDSTFETNHPIQRKIQQILFLCKHNSSMV